MKVAMKSKGLRAFGSFLITLFVATYVGTMVASSFGINPYVPTAVVMVLAFVSGVTRTVSKYKKTSSLNFFITERTVVRQGIQQEFWVNYIIENLFKDNSFTSKCFDESDAVLAGSVVHIPQAGAKPTVVKNRSTLPATIVQRTDTDVTYALDIYTTDPTVITKAEEIEISYNKIDSVLGEHMEAMVEAYSDDILYKWAPTDASQIITTTGAADGTALTDGATGTRNKFVIADLKAAKVAMNKAKIPKEERYALIPTDLYAQLTSDPDLMKRDGVNGGELDLKMGIVIKLEGFNIMERSDTTIYTNDGVPVPKAPGAAHGTTDNQAVICWQKNQVAKALGTVDFFEQLNAPTMYGNIYSALVKMGARKRRANGAGVIAIVQKWVS